MLNDLRYAFRTLGKTPGFTIVAVLVLALGIGANTAIFSVLNTVVLRPLAYRDSGRLVTLWSLSQKTGHTFSVSAPDLHDWHDQSTVFDAFAYYAEDRTSVTAGGEPERAYDAMVSPEFFTVMGVQPQLGQLFTPGENKAADSAAVLISDAFWRRNFGGDPKALGKPVKMYEKAFTVVGVLPPGFHYPGSTDLWVPSTVFPEAMSRTAHNYRVVARLKPGVTLAAARTEMTAIAARIEKQYPENTGKSAAVIPMLDYMVRNVKTTLYLLVGAVAFVLLIACANVANLMLARAGARTREIAIRAAMGASRGRIIRQLIVESLALALVASGAGLLLAVWGDSALVALAPQNIPRLDEVAIDGGVLLFTLASAMLASLLFGLAPALQVSRADLNDALKQGGGRSVSAGGGKIRNVLVVAEVALSMMLVVGAGLALRSFLNLGRVDPGFRPQQLLVMDTDVPAPILEGAKKASLFYQELLRRVAAVPGVISVSAVDGVPTGSGGSDGLYLIEGRPAPPPGQSSRQWAGWLVVAPGYFHTLGIPLVRGRDFDTRDRLDTPFTVIINESMARQSWLHEDPIGQRIRIGLWGASGRYMTIVGVVADVRQSALDRAAGPWLYVPYTQHPIVATSLAVVTRVAGDPGALSGTLRRITRDLNPDVPVKFTTMEAVMADSVAPPRFRMILLGVFAALALVLAMVGVYGVMAYLVGRRSAEIGLRMALGARPIDVLVLILTDSVKLAGIGLVLGLAGSLALTRVMTGMLFQVSATDPATYAIVTLALALAVVAAGYLPARRAASVDPVVALREE